MDNQNITPTENQNQPTEPTPVADSLNKINPKKKSSVGKIIGIIAAVLIFLYVAMTLVVNFSKINLPASVGKAFIHFNKKSITAGGDTIKAAPLTIVGGLDTAVSATDTMTADQLAVADTAKKPTPAPVAKEEPKQAEKPKATEKKVVAETVVKPTPKAVEANNNKSVAATTAKTITTKAETNTKSKEAAVVKTTPATTNTSTDKKVNTPSSNTAASTTTAPISSTPDEGIVANKKKKKSGVTVVNYNSDNTTSVASTSTPSSTSTTTNKKEKPAAPIKSKYVKKADDYAVYNPDGSYVVPAGKISSSSAANDKTYQTYNYKVNPNEKKSAKAPVNVSNGRYVSYNTAEASFIKASKPYPTSLDGYLKAIGNSDIDYDTRFAFSERCLQTYFTPGATVQQVDETGKVMNTTTIEDLLGTMRVNEFSVNVKDRQMSGSRISSMKYNYKF